MRAKPSELNIRFNLTQHFIMACGTVCLCMQCSGYTAYLEPQYHDSHGWYMSMWALQFREPF